MVHHAGLRPWLIFYNRKPYFIAEKSPDTVRGIGALTGYSGREPEWNKAYCHFIEVHSNGIPIHRLLQTTYRWVTDIHRPSDVHLAGHEGLGPRDSRCSPRGRILSGQSSRRLGLNQWTFLACRWIGHGFRYHRPHDRFDNWDDRVSQSAQIAALPGTFSHPPLL